MLQAGSARRKESASIYIELAYLAASVLFSSRTQRSHQSGEGPPGHVLRRSGDAPGDRRNADHHEIAATTWIVAGRDRHESSESDGLWVPIRRCRSGSRSRTVRRDRGQLVAVAEDYRHGGHAVGADGGARLRGMFGSLTVTGSFMAFGKLQELLPGRRSRTPVRT